MKKRMFLILLASIVILQSTLYASSVCKLEGCNKPIYKEELCKTHYKMEQLAIYAANYVFDQIIPFGGVVRDVVGILKDDEVINDDSIPNIEGKNSNKKAYDKRYEKITLGKFRFPIIDDNGNITSYKNKDIEWYVIDKEDGKKLLLSVDAFGCSPYVKLNDTSFYTKIDVKKLEDTIFSGSNEYLKYLEDSMKICEEKLDYKDTYINKYLNEEIYNNCFSAEEKKKIVETEIFSVHYNEDNTVQSIESNIEKIFPIGVDDIDKYLKNINLTFGYSFDDDYIIDKYYDNYIHMSEWTRDICECEEEGKKCYAGLAVMPNNELTGFKVFPHNYVGHLMQVRPMMWIIE